MNFENYKNKMNYPERPSKPSLNMSKPTPADHRKYADELEKYEAAMVEYRAKIDEYRMENARVKELFKEDLFRELGITDHPKREKLFELAWDDGHSGGYSEVYNKADDLSQLLI